MDETINIEDKVEDTFPESKSLNGNEPVSDESFDAEDNDDLTEDESDIEDSSGNDNSSAIVNQQITGDKDAVTEKETKWYVLRVVSGKERKTKEYLDKDIIRNGWDKIIKQVFLPVEKVYKVLNGKKVMRERNFYPGYIMIEVADGKLSDEVIQHLSNISNVMHFLTDGKGSKGNIISLRKAEVNKMLGKVDEMADAGGIKMSEPFIVGETIKIIDGPFNDFNGVIEEVNDEKKKLKVQVKIFGRATPVELNYMQVEKLG
jgi:transcriptional antiterminator NusG